MEVAGGLAAVGYTGPVGFTIARRLRWLGLAIGRLEPLDGPERRFRGIAQGALSALGTQGTGLLVSLASVPLTVGYLGAERYGAWMVMSSLLAWLAVTDFGLGNALTSSLSSAYGRDDAHGAGELVSTGFWALSAIALVLLGVGAFAWRRVDWPNLLNVRSAQAVGEVGPAMGLAFALFCLASPLAMVDRVYTSRQQGAVGNAWGAAANVATLAAIVAATRTRGGLVALVAATSGASLAVKLASAAWLFARRPELRPRWSSFDRRVAMGFAVRGGEFFFVQIAALVLYSTDNVIIARVLGASQVTPYSVAFRLFTLPGLGLSLAFPYLWAAYAEALARGDNGWVLRTLRLTTTAATIVGAVVSLPLVVFGREIIRLWAGAAATPPMAVLAWMGLWSLVLAPANSVVCLLNAAGRVRWQVWTGVLCAVANVMVSVWWARVFGISGVIAATVTTYLAISAIPLAIVGGRVVRSLRGRS